MEPQISMTPTKERKTKYTANEADLLALVAGHRSRIEKLEADVAQLRRLVQAIQYKGDEA